jgi:hypothetical protein
MLSTDARCRLCRHPARWPARPIAIWEVLNNQKEPCNRSEIGAALCMRLRTDSAPDGNTLILTGNRGVNDPWWRAGGVHRAEPGAVTPRSHLHLHSEARAGRHNRVTRTCDSS